MVSPPVVSNPTIRAITVMRRGQEVIFVVVMRQR
jgi:hypothetical protein